MPPKPPPSGKDVRSEPTPKRVRAFVRGEPVVDSERARIVWFGPVSRTYAVPREDVRGHVADATGHVEDPKLGRVPAAPLELEKGRVEDAVLVPDADAGTEDRVVLNWNAMDQWFEEDEEVFVHPHDPWHRIDIRRSTRHVVIEVDGERVAETRRPWLLFETGLPTRYYVPPLDVRLDLLEESDTTTGCAYKGFAHYRHVRVRGRSHEDLVWTYPSPFAEAERVRGLHCFYQERADFIVDGERLERPRTPWSRED